MADTEEQVPLLEPTTSPASRRQSRIGTVCLLFVIFLQAWGFTYKRDHSLLGNWISDHDYIIIFSCGSCLIYIVPIAVGLYVDLFAGRLKSLSFGLGVKVTGSLSSLIINLLYAVYFYGDRDKKLIQVLGVIYCVTLLLYYLGLIFIIPTIMTYIIQQNQFTYNGKLTLVRWVLLLGILGRCLASAVLHHSNHNEDYGTARYFRSIDQGVVLGCDVLSIALFLIGKSRYKTVTTTDGEKSGKDIWRIVRTYICHRTSLEYPIDNFLDSEVSRQAEQHIRKAIDRQKIRKVVLFLALQSSIAVSMMAILFFYNLGYGFYKEWIKSKEIENKIGNIAAGIAVICLVPVTEVILWKLGHHLEPLVKQLKAIGTLATLGAIGLMVSALIHSLHVSIYWLVPVYVSMGLMALHLLSFVLTLCCMISPSGLETLTICLMLNLPMLLSTLEAIVTFALGEKQVSHTEEHCYILGGVTIAVLVCIYLPVCRWFLKADATIKEMEELRETAAGGEQP